MFQNWTNLAENASALLSRLLFLLCQKPLQICIQHATSPVCLGLPDEIGRVGGSFAEMNSGCMVRQMSGQQNEQVAVGLERKRGRDNVYVTVRDNNVDQALRVLKKKLQREGVFREMKNRRAYEKPSERRARESAESTRRVRKLMRKRMEREGY